jgi:site-specific recombinase XerD
MIEHLFTDDCPPDDFRDGSMAPYISHLELKLLEQGFSKPQIRRLLLTASGLGRYLDTQGIALVDAGSNNLEAYSRACGRTRSGKRTDYNTGLSTIQRIMQVHGLLNKPEPSNSADWWLGQFEDNQRSVRGLKLATCAGYRCYLRRFIVGLFQNDQPDWKQLTGPYISKFLITELKTVRAARKTLIAGIRNFLRFLVFKGVIARGLLRAIPKSKTWRYSNLPHPLTMEDHELVLKACQSEAAGSPRDRAFIALLALLGLRSGEVRQLRPDDIDWREGLLHIRPGKCLHERLLPLPKEAGELLTDYIRHARPSSPYREVFLTVLAPREPLGCAAATYLVRQSLERAGLRGPRPGTHCFRHTAATLMVRRGATIKQVADVLGHKSISTTQIYVKLDEESLQAVGLPWPGGEL